MIQKISRKNQRQVYITKELIMMPVDVAVNIMRGIVYTVICDVLEFDDLKSRCRRAEENYSDGRRL